MVNQEATADDVVQEAWLASLEQPPERIRDLNTWLRKVVRNVAARNFRRSRRRRDLELSTARREAIEPPESTVGRASLNALLHESVRSLREPYRSVLTRRFLEERSVAEVAQELGHSPATVRSQVGRGLVELRRVLDRKHGGQRERWLPALAVLAIDRAEPRALTGWTGTAIVSWSVLLAAGGFALWLAVGAGFGTTDKLRPLPDVGRLAEGPGPPTEVGEVGIAGPGAPTAAREPALDANTRPTMSVPSVASTPQHELEVSVRRADGSLPRDAWVRVWGRGLVELGQYPTDAAGRVNIFVDAADLMPPLRSSDPAGGVYVDARDRDEAWSHEYHVSFSPKNSTRRLEVRTRGAALELRIHVVDQTGQPIPQATVIIEGSHGGFFSPDGSPLDEHIVMHATDEQGELVLKSMPRRVYRMSASAPGFVTVERSFQGAGKVLEASFELSRGSVVYGQVRGPDGPIVDARVWELDWRRVQFDGGRVETQGDENGFFDLGGMAPGPRRLFARSEADPELFACEVLEVLAGEDVEWNPNLTRTPPVRLTILDEKQAPIEGAVALLTQLGPGPAWVSDYLITGRDGRLFFFHCPPGELNAVVTRSTHREETPSEYRVRAGEENIIRLAPMLRPGAFAGVLLDDEGKPPASATLFGAYGKSTFDVPVVAESGEFLALDLLPGKYALSVLSERGVHPLGSHGLLPGATYELGLIRLPRPLDVALEWGEVSPSAAAPWEVMSHVEGRRPHRIDVLETALPELQLLEGTYRIQPVGDPLRSLAFEVSAHPATTVSLDRRR